jgi:hypothetical protein
MYSERVEYLNARQHDEDRKNKLEGCKKVDSGTILGLHSLHDSKFVFVEHAQLYST